MALVMVAAPATSWSADQTVGERVDDAKITTAIKTKLTTERFKNLVNVHVETQNRVVHLDGKVPTAHDKAEVERLARGTKGVRSVTSNVRVEASEKSPSASPRQ